MLADCKTLDQYFEAYGDIMGARATKALAPLHVPSRDPVHPAVEHLLRRPFDAQAHVITGIIKAWGRQKSVVLAAEMGVGKTFIASAACYAARACVERAAGRPFRAIVMCPDHLLDKWKREIEETCPGAVVHKFKDWKEVLKLTESLEVPWEKDIAGSASTATATAPVSTGPGPHFKDGVFVDQPYQFEDRPLTPSPMSGVVRQGRKRLLKPTQQRWYLIGRDQSKFDPAWKLAFPTRRQMVVDRFQAKALRRKGATLDELTARVAYCPRCGHVVMDKDGLPVPHDEIKKTQRLTCQRTISRWRQEGDNAREVLTDCGEPLWQFTRKPWRWAPARIIHQGGLRFNFMILDEAHELKAADSAQGNAAGTLMACSKKVIAMTGTLIGGYAEHLFPLVMRLDARSLVRDGFVWNGFKAFNQVYGRIETTVTRRETPPDKEHNKHSRGSSHSRTMSRTRPGVMPQFFGDHLIDKTIFLTLEEVSEGLPSLSEEIVPIPMDDDQAEAYGKLENWFRDIIKKMLVMGNKSALGSFLTSLLCYPDYPFNWETIHVKWGEDSSSFTPRHLDPECILPKEQALIDLAHREMAEGRQTWIYATMTQVRDCGERWRQILERAGVRCGYMKSSVDRRKREEWIYSKGKDLDVVISHPKLVETGLDLFAKDGNHNFPTICFGQTGYNLFTLRQASRRSWRIGQPLPCRTVFLYYAKTMQEAAMTLMGKKMAAAEALEGKFSAEGLAAMGGDDDATMALAKALVSRVDIPADRAWSKTLGFEKKEVTRVPAPPVHAAGTQFTADEWEMLRRLYARMSNVG